MPQRSPNSNLAVFTSNIYKAFDKFCQVDVIYTDFSKAFDKVNHHILLLKAEYIFGFSEQLIQLLNSYLSNRLLYVVSNNIESRTFFASSGVPQGSNLGPLLFLIFINDIISTVDCNILLFADDLKIFMNVSDETDCVKLQENVDRLYVWSSINKLSFNINKCCVMSYTRKKTLTSFNYLMNNEPLKRVEEVLDLGILMDTKLYYNNHINLIVSKSLKIIGFIYRNSKEFKNVKTILMLYFSFVRSKLEYCALIWSPFYNECINKIEGVQKKLLKFTYYREHGIYPLDIIYNELLQIYKLPSLQKRRIITDLMFLYKICNNLIDCTYLLSEITFKVPDTRTRKSLMFHINCPRTNYLQSSPLARICIEYNNICNDNFVDVNCSKIKSFKKYIEQTINL